METASPEPLFEIACQCTIQCDVAATVCAVLARVKNLKELPVMPFERCEFHCVVSPMSEVANTIDEAVCDFTNIFILKKEGIKPIEPIMRRHVILAPQRCCYTSDCYVVPCVVERMRTIEAYVSSEWLQPSSPTCRLSALHLPSSQCC
jgi:hypothetical protein